MEQVWYQNKYERATLFQFMKRKEPFQCETFKHVLQALHQKQRLKSYIVRIHEGKKPFKCDCDLSFTSHQRLNEHVASVHENKKLTFPCVNCNSSFTLKQWLNDHMHWKYSWKKCFICGTTFSQKKSIGVSVSEKWKPNITNGTNKWLFSFINYVNVSLHDFFLEKTFHM